MLLWVARAAATPSSRLDVEKYASLAPNTTAQIVTSASDTDGCYSDSKLVLAHRLCPGKLRLVRGVSAGRADVLRIIRRGHLFLSEGGGLEFAFSGARSYTATAR